MSFPIKILIVEDSSDDALLIMDALREGGYDPTFERVDTYDNLKSALINQWDIIIADYNMPAFSGIAALELVRKQGVDTPFIIVSGTISDNTAVNAMRSGAQDYVLKDNLSRLAAAVDRELRDANVRQKRKKAEEALQESERQYQNLFENAPVGIFRSFPEGQFLLSNPALAKILGYSSQEELIKEITDIAAQIYAEPEKWSRIMDILEKQDGWISDEAIWRKKDGNLITVNMTIRKVLNYTGTILYLEGFIEDISERKQAEEEKKNFYRETIKSVTQGKLNLVSSNDINEYLESTKLVLSLESAEDTEITRHKILDFCASNGVDHKKLELFEAAIGEAITNAFKHAKDNKIYAGVCGDSIWVAVSDKGSGITTLTLPGATLRRGFSTKASMGMGYSIMMDTSDKILLCTGPQGTTVILLIDINVSQKIISLDDLPDTWDTIPTE